MVDLDALVNDDFGNDSICPMCDTIQISDGKGGMLCNCAAKAELANKIAAAQEAEKNPVVKSDDKKIDENAPFDPRAALKVLPNAPTDEIIETWKKQFGAVYTMPFDTKEIYLWRPLRRREYQMLQANEALVKDEARFQEQVVMRAILWPKLDVVGLNNTRAGMVQTLFSVIMQGSYFLHPDFALSLISEL